jgi:hypothetical protein
MSRRGGARPVRAPSFAILADQVIEIVGIEKKVVKSRAVPSAYWLNHDPTGMVAITGSSWADGQLGEVSDMSTFTTFCG